MSFTLPTPISLHTDSADQNVGSIGSNLTLRTKSAGNLPITTYASRVQYSSSGGEAEGVFFGTAGQSSLGNLDVFLFPTLMIWSLQFNAPNRLQTDTLENGGVRFWLGSGSDPKNNYKEFFIGGNDTPFSASQSGPVTICMDLADTSNNNTIGDFDTTDISAYGVATVHDGIVGNQFGECFFQRSFLLGTDKTSTKLPYFSGTTSFDDAVEAVQGTDYTNKIGSWVTKSGSSFFIPVPFSFGNGTLATIFDDNGVAVVSPSSNATNQENFRLTNDAMRVYLKTRDDEADTVQLSGSYAWGTAAPWDFDVSNASTCTLSGTFNGMGTFTLGSSVTAIGTFSLADGYAVVCNGAEISGCTINGDLKLQGITTSSFSDVSCNNLAFDTAGTYQLEKCDIASVTNTSGGTITIQSTGSSIAENLDATIIIQDLRGISITGIVAGSRIQIKNMTTGVEVNNQIISGTSYSQTYAEGTGFTEGDVIRARLMFTDTATSYLEFETTTIATDTGWTVLATQIADTVYDSIGLDGTAITKFSADYDENDVNLNISQNFEIAEFYAWWKYNLFLSEGISDFFGVLVALDEANFRINNTILDFYLDSIATASVRQLDNRRIYRADLAYPVRQPTTSGYGLDVVWRNIVFVAPVEVSVPALTAAQSTQLGNIVEVLADTNELQTNQGNFATATGFNTVAPDNASITEILADTNELQTNQGNFATATGFNTVAPDNTSIGTILTDLTTYTASALPKLRSILVDTAELQTNQGNWLTADVSGLSTFDPDADTVVNVTTVATTTNLTNGGGGGGLTNEQSAKLDEIPSIKSNTNLIPALL